MKINMPAYVKEVIEKIEKAGFEAFAVGGCVRDFVMGKTPSDWDITTSARPDDILKIFNDFKTVTSGISHGTVAVITNHTAVEITTYRKDGIYSDNRHPDSVIFTNSLSEDLSRRDFTMNALAYSKKSGIIDKFAGISDIENMTVRCVGNPDKRFFEDALRIIRALRFASVLSFNLEEETHQSARRNRNLLLNIAPERILSEFKKLLLGDYVEKILHEYKDIIAVFLPEIVPTFDFDQRNNHHIYDAWGHIVKGIAVSPKLVYVRLAMLFHDIAKPQCLKFDSRGFGHFKGHPALGEKIAVDCLKRLHCDKKTIKIVAFLIRYHDTPLPADKVEIKKWLSRYGVALMRLLFEVKIADNLAKNRSFPQRLIEAKEGRAILRTIIKNDECFSLDRLAVCGDDLINAGFPPGQRLGIILHALLDAVIEEKCKNEKPALLALAESHRV